MHGAIGIVLVIGWVAFWLYWLGAAGGAKPAQGRGAGYWGTRIVVLVVNAVFLRFTISHGASGQVWLAGIGLALWVAGLALAIWARLYIGSNWGSPMSKNDDPELVTTGPYHAIRHPIYTGIIVAMIGTSLATSLYGLIAVAVLGGFFVYSALTEERNMAETFPDTYPPYKASTKMLIPHVF